MKASLSRTSVSLLDLAARSSRHADFPPFSALAEAIGQKDEVQVRSGALIGLWPLMSVQEMKPQSQSDAHKAPGDKESDKRQS